MYTEFMPVSTLIKLYLVTVPVFFIVDMIWLTLVAKTFYTQQLGSLLTKNINWGAALLFYLLYIAGIIIFAVAPSLPKKDLMHAVTFGALFGFFCYATYDLTNLSTLKNWPLNITIVDIIWGTVLTGLVATISYWIAVNFLKI